MDLSELRKDRKYREFLLQLRHAEARGRLDLPELRTSQKYRQLLFQLRDAQAGGREYFHS